MDKQVFYKWLDTMPYSLGLGDLEQNKDGSMTITIVEADVLENAKKEREKLIGKRLRLGEDLKLSDEAFAILEKAGEDTNLVPPSDFGTMVIFR